MATNNAFDFSGVFNIQKQYLADLSAISHENSNAINYYKSVSTGLNDLYDIFRSAQPASGVALDHQNKMIDIINTEKERLDRKKTGIDNAYATQQRLIQFNESYREKNMQYINILIIIIITIVIYLALLIIEKNLTFIPSVVMDILKTLLFMITIIIIYVMISKINKRDPMDYQKLLFVAPPDMSNNIAANSTNTDGSGNNMTDTSGCVQSACCSSETTWNNDIQKCVPKQSGFTLMDQIYGNNNCKKCCGDNVKYLPYSPYEFDSYVKI